MSRRWTPREARDWIREHSKQCPNCDGAIFVRIKGPSDRATDQRISELLLELSKLGATFTVESVEDAEESLREGKAFGY
jgi:hypothetical protein